MKTITLSRHVWLSDEVEPKLVECNHVVGVYPNPMGKPKTDLPLRLYPQGTESKYLMTITLERVEK